MTRRPTIAARVVTSVLLLALIAVLAGCSAGPLDRAEVIIDGRLLGRSAGSG